MAWGVPGGAGPCSLRGNWLFREGRPLLGNQPPLLSVTLAALRCWENKPLIQRGPGLHPTSCMPAPAEHGDGH